MELLEEKQTEALTWNPLTWNPHNLPALAPPQEELDPTPKSALVYWYFKTRGPSSWGQGQGHNPVTGQRCVGNAMALLYGETEAAFQAIRRLDLVLENPLSSLPDFNDKPGRTFEEVLDLCRRAGV